MPHSKNKKHRIKFIHIFVAAAFLVVLLNFVIAGFAPYFMVLIPAFPFCLLCVLPLSRQYIGQPDTLGTVGAGIGALISVVPAMALFAYDMMTGWKGGADIGLGLLYLFLPVYSVVFMALGYFIAEIFKLMHQRNFSRLPNIFRTLSLFIGIGFSLYFLLKLHNAYDLWAYNKKTDPSAAELYAIDLWLFALLAAAPCWFR
ncbi:MAG: hypothetical protein PVF29_14335 [Desulfobacterales bacterium]|jgi:hypothetical protein